jgi:hypothetical protein
MSGANLLAKLARKLPRLKDAFRDFVNHTKGQIEGAHGDLLVRLNTCEQALGPETAPAVKQAFDALRCAAETVLGLSPRRESLELTLLVDGLLSLLEAPEMADVLRRAETTAAAEPPAAVDTPSFSVTLDTAGLTDAEAVMLATGLQLGVQLTLSHGSAASVSPAEIRRAIEMHREAQQPRGLLH